MELGKYCLLRIPKPLTGQTNLPSSGAKRKQDGSGVRLIRARDEGRPSSWLSPPLLVHPSPIPTPYPPEDPRAHGPTASFLGPPGETSASYLVRSGPARGDPGRSTGVGRPRRAGQDPQTPSAASPRGPGRAGRSPCLRAGEPAPPPS